MALPNDGFHLPHMGLNTFASGLN